MAADLSPKSTLATGSVEEKLLDELAKFDLSHLTTYRVDEVHKVIFSPHAETHGEADIAVGRLIMKLWDMMNQDGTLWDSRSSQDAENAEEAVSELFRDVSLCLPINLAEKLLVISQFIWKSKRKRGSVESR